MNTAFHPVLFRKKLFVFIGINGGGSGYGITRKARDTATDLIKKTKRHKPTNRKNPYDE